MLIDVPKAMHIRKQKLLIALGLACILWLLAACGQDIITSTSTTDPQTQTDNADNGPATTSATGEINVSIDTTTPTSPAQADGSGSGGTGGSDSTSASGSDANNSASGTNNGAGSGPATDADIATATTYELADAAFTSRSKVTTVGIDEIYFGTWFQDAAAAARTEWVGIPEGVIPECLVVTPSNGPEGVRVWLWRGFVERVDLTNPDIRTRSGYGVGTKLETLLDALGDNLEITEHEDGSKTAVFVPADEGDNAFRLVFEMDFDDQVVSYRSGRASLIDQTEDTCS